MREIGRWRRADAILLEGMLLFRDEKFPSGDVGQVFNLPGISVETDKASDHIVGSGTGRLKTCPTNSAQSVQHIALAVQMREQRVMRERLAGNSLHQLTGTELLAARVDVLPQPVE